MPDSNFTPAPLIPAATVVLIREHEGKLQTLMLRRNKHLKAFGGMWVFPGGRVDDADLPGGAEISRAKHAAIREAQEETGLELSPDDLAELSLWIPPPQEKRRFSTWFFVGAAPDAPVQIDEGEIHDYRWMCPKEIVANVPNPNMMIVPPTYVTLATVARYETVREALAAIHARGNERFETRFVTSDSGFTTLWAPDAGYESLDLNLPGPRRRLVTNSTKWEYITQN